MKILILSLGLLLFGTAVRAEELPRPPHPKIDLPFPMGEKLTYSIYWGIIGVGRSVATTEWAWANDQWMILIKFRTVSNGVIAKLYPVNDTVKSYIDPQTLRPLLFEMDLNEGKHSRKSETYFNWERMEAYYTKFHDDKDDEVVTVDLKPGSRDLVSFMYFMRGTTFVDKEDYKFEVLSDYKLYELDVKTAGHDKIKLDDYGKVKSLKLHPEAKFEGVFVRSGKMSLWLSADSRQLLTKLLLDTPFANVKLLLKDVSGPEAEKWVKEQKK